MPGSMMLVLGLGAIAAALAMLAMLLGSRRPVTGVARSLEYIDRLGVQQSGATQTTAQPMAIPFAPTMVDLATRLSPDSISSRIQRRLDVAGNPGGLTPERLLGYKGLALVGGAVLGGLFGVHHGPIAVVLWAAAIGAAGFFVPDLLLYNAGLKRQDLLRRTLPDALDMLTISVEAGLGFDAALAQVARNTTGPLAGEFTRVLSEMQIGKGRAQAFQDLSDRTTLTELQVFVAALVQADKQGIPIANVLREQAKEMRLKRRQRAEEAAAKVPVKILFPLIVCIFPTMFIVIIGPGAISIIKSLSGTL